MLTKRRRSEGSGARPDSSAPGEGRMLALLDLFQSVSDRGDRGLEIFEASFS